MGQQLIKLVKQALELLFHLVDLLQNMGTVTSLDALAPTTQLSPTLPDYLPCNCISIPCTTPTITSSAPVSSICSGTSY